MSCHKCNKKMELGDKVKIICFDCFTKISDLEAKLAEKEHTINTLIEDHKASQEWYKMQLAEKEKERHEEWKTGKEWKWAWQKEHRDKISFALEQLEKVKELCKEKFNLWKNGEWEGYAYDNIDVSNAIFDIQANIEEQIKQLKEMK